MNNLKRLFWTSSDLSNTGSIQMSNLGQDNRAADVWGRVETSHWSRLSRHCTLIGWDNCKAAPAPLCHKDTAQGTQSSLLEAFLAFRCFHSVSMWISDLESSTLLEIRDSDEYLLLFWLEKREKWSSQKNISPSFDSFSLFVSVLW